MNNLRNCFVTNRFFLFSCLCFFGMLLFPSPTNAYSKGKRPITNFMKIFSDVEREDLENQNKLYESTFLPGKPESYEEAAKAGKMFYEKHHEKFEKLYKDAATLLSEPPPLFDKTLLTSKMGIMPTLDFRHIRSLARCFQLVTIYHYSQKDYKKAVKTTLITIWFSHSVARGGDGFPSLIDLMISIALRGIAISDPFWSALVQGDFSKGLLNQVESILVKLESTQPAFAESLEWELFGMLSSVKNELEKDSGEFAKLPAALHGKKKEILEAAVNYMAATNRQIVNMATAYRLAPLQLHEESKRFFEIVTKRCENTLASMFNIPRRIAHTLEAISTPNFQRAYDQYLKTCYLEKGTILLIRFLKFRKKGQPIPKNQKEFSKMARAKIPADLYAGQGKRCIYFKNNNWFGLYSIGLDQTDDGGDPEKDFILFRAPIK